MLAQSFRWSNMTFLINHEHHPLAGECETRRKVSRMNGRTAIHQLANVVLRFMHKGRNFWTAFLKYLLLE